MKISGELGSSFELKISATGVPSPRYYWFKVITDLLTCTVWARNRFNARISNGLVLEWSGKAAIGIFLSHFVRFCTME